MTRDRLAEFRRKVQPHSLWKYYLLTRIIMMMTLIDKFLNIFGKQAGISGTGGEGDNSGGNANSSSSPIISTTNGHVAIEMSRLDNELDQFFHQVGLIAIQIKMIMH